MCTILLSEYFKITNPPYFEWKAISVEVKIFVFDAKVHKRN